MVDWIALVEKQLGRLNVTRAQREEIAAELAGHLEDLEEEGRAAGLSESEAMCRALNEAGDWCRLAREIRHTKHQEEQMNQRTRALWLPGAVSLAATMGWLMILTRTDFEPRLLWLDGRALVLYLPWLAVLPLFGAAGAYLSRRGRGEPVARLAAGLFPAVAMLGLLCSILPAALILDRAVRAHFMLVGFAVAVFNWVALPGFALMLGVLPFLRIPRRATAGPRASSK